jgi:N-6 DNA methylase
MERWQDFLMALWIHHNLRLASPVFPVALRRFVSPLVEKIIELDLQRYENVPEWVQQHKDISSGKTTWNDYSFKERACRGWLQPYLLSADEIIGSKRWLWWSVAMANEKLPDDPIPQIDFSASPDQSVIKMLRKCLEHHACLMSSAGHHEFFDWILWGFGHGDEAPNINDKVNEHWYRTFDIASMIEKPCDYLGDIISEAKAGRTYWNNPNAFFPTPHSVVKMMIQVTMGTADIGDKDPRLASVMEPCAGTGRMLMEASNYSVNLFGTDIDLVCVKACKINMFLYVPWVICPADWIPHPSASNIEAIKGKPIAVSGQQLSLF